MATVYGSNATKILVNQPAEKAGKGEQGGVKRVIYDKLVLSADLAAADVIKLGGLIPKGALITNAKLVFPDMDTATNGLFDFGWEAGANGTEAADADGFGNDINVQAAGDYDMQADQSTAAGLYKRFEEAVQPIITIAGETTASSGTIHMEIEYVLD